MTEAPHEDWEGGSLLEQCNSALARGVLGFVVTGIWVSLTPQVDAS